MEKFGELNGSKAFSFKVSYEISNIKQSFLQQENIMNMKYIFISNKNHNASIALMDFVENNKIKVMLSLSKDDTPIQILSKNTDTFTHPIDKIQLKSLLTDNSPNKLNDNHLEIILNDLYQPVVSKAIMLNNIANSKKQYSDNKKNGLSHSVHKL